jgi:hypothetical protein
MSRRRIATHRPWLRIPLALLLAAGLAPAAAAAPAAASPSFLFVAGAVSCNEGRGGGFELRSCATLTGATPAFIASVDAVPAPPEKCSVVATLLRNGVPVAKHVLGCAPTRFTAVPHAGAGEYVLRVQGFTGGQLRAQVDSPPLPVPRATS